MRYLFLLLVFAACDVIDPYPVSDLRWVDGDSGTIDGERFRLADVDAPETRNADCSAERVLGEKAKNYVRNLTQRGDILVTGDYGAERYGRRVIDLSINGEDVSSALIEKRYLQSWAHLNGRALEAKPDWCCRPLSTPAG